MMGAIRLARHSGAQARLLLLVILSVFLAQTVAIQTHVHFAKAAASSPVAGTPERTKPTLSSTQTPTADPADCPLCRDLAIAGHYILPDGVTLSASALVLFWLFVPASVAVAVQQRSHRWQSRAPPR